MRGMSIPKPPPSLASVRQHAQSVQQQQQHHQQQQQCFDPLPWDTYFDSRQYFDNGVNGSGRFCCYTKGDMTDYGKPLVFLLHGGGFCGLSWAAMCSCLAVKAACRCVAMDIRGHGDTEVPEGDFSLDTLAGDAARLIERIRSDEEDKLAIILIGHSMGGAIAIHLAQSDRLGASVSALVVIDVVEGSAMDALGSMRGYLASRPSRFPSLQSAIQWCHRSGTVRNLDSARVSFPGHLRLVQPTAAASTAAEAAAEPPPPPQLSSTSAIPEEPESDEDNDTDDGTREQQQQPQPQPKLMLRGPALLQPRGAAKPPLPSASAASKKPSFTGRSLDPSQPFYTWRIDLALTEPYWSDWFNGMSGKFLAAPAAKLLLLAGVDRLDRELTVGQMQGKFQMQVLPRSGHAVHEDHPDHVAEVVASFLVRNKLAEPLAEFHPVPPGC